MVGDTSGVQEITSPVNITDPPPGDYADLTIDDSADTTAHSASVSNTSVTNLAPATISYSPQDLRSFTVNGGTGGNTFTLTSTPSGLGTTATHLNTGTGADTVNIQGTASNTALYLQGQNGHDTVSITNAGSAQGISGAINIENDGGFDALTIDDSADTTARTATFNTFTLGGDTTGAITSANSNHNTAIGWADSANLNGATDIFDLNNLLPHFNGSGSWTKGDSTYNGAVDIFDLNAMLPNFNQTLGSQVTPTTTSTTATVVDPIAPVSGNLAKEAAAAAGASALVAPSSSPGTAIGVSPVESLGHRKWRTRDVFNSRIVDR
jgi:hypothetical protein